MTPLKRGDRVWVVTDRYFTGAEARCIFREALKHVTARVEHVRVAEDGTELAHLFWYGPGQALGFRRPWATTLPVEALRKEPPDTS